MGWQQARHHDQDRERRADADLVAGQRRADDRSHRWPWSVDDDLQEEHVVSAEGPAASLAGLFLVASFSFQHSRERSDPSASLTARGAPSPLGPQALSLLAFTFCLLPSSSAAVRPVTGSMMSGAISASGPSTNKRSRKRGCGTSRPGADSTMLHREESDRDRACAAPPDRDVRGRILLDREQMTRAARAP